MNLTPEQREQVRLSILRHGRALGGFRLGLEVQYLRSEGFSGITPEQVQLEIHYLEDKGLLVAAKKEVSPEIRQWRTSAAGSDYLATQGLE